MIDVENVSDVQMGDEVTIPGCQGDVKITADDIAKRCGTINYEVVASLTRRIPIRYIQEK